MKIFLLILFSALFFLTSCIQFGENPSGEHLEQIQKSPNYSIEDERFVNRRENLFDEMRESDSFWDNPSKRFSNNMLFNSRETVPESDLTEIKPPKI